MRRLIAKELWENRVYAIGALVILAILILLGDPLFFRGDSFRIDSMILILATTTIPLAMGLGAYSREFTRDTLSFALSRPIRWWWLYLSKILAGFILCALVSALSAAIYAAVCRPPYRAFLEPTSIAFGIGIMALWLGGIYILGFIFSCVLSGIALSFALLVGVYIAYFLLIDWVFAKHLSAIHIGLVVPAALVAANVLAVRTPMVVMRARRVSLWLKIVVGGFVAMALAAWICYIAGVLPGRPYRPPVASPDGRFTAYHNPVNPRRNTCPQNLWIRPRNGKALKVDSRMWFSIADWSRDGRALYYFTNDGGAVLKTAKETEGWRSSIVCALPRFGEADERDDWVGSGYESMHAVTWSPSGTRFAFLLHGWSDNGGYHKPLFIVVDLSARRAAEVSGNGAYFWWLDDHRITVMDLSGNVTVVSADLK